MLYRYFLAFLLTCVSSLLLLAGSVLYARWVEPRWVEESQWQLQAAHWKGRPLRLAVLTDLHARAGDGDYLDDLVRRVVEAGPDVVLLLGDYVNERCLGDTMEAETLGQHLSPLAQFPCYAVLGNHDYDEGADKLRHMLTSFGAQMLEGKVSSLNIGGDTLYLGGMRCLCTFDTPGEMEPLPPEASTFILLTHSPAGAHYAPEGTTATLCGHTHGGQVCLPGGIPILRPDKRVQWEEMKGELWVNGRPVYVSRGLGMSMMPLRFFCRPEVVMVELCGVGE